MNYTFSDLGLPDDITVRLTYLEQVVSTMPDNEIAEWLNYLFTLDKVLLSPIPRESVNDV